jgi:HEAT repeat protein
MNHPEAVLVLAELLADPELPVRIASARALAYYGAEATMPVLRLKVLTGDRDPEVTAECLTALLKIGRSSSIPFVARFLDSADPTLAESAALALGESREPEALEILSQWWSRTGDQDLSRIALLSIAMLRIDEATLFLLSLIRDESAPVARDAIRAFEMYREDEALIGRVRAVAGERDDLDLAEAVALLSA